MDKNTNIKKYTTPQQCVEALKGMLEAKQKWLEYVAKREKELAIS